MNSKLSDWLQYRAKLIVCVQDPVSVLTTDMFTSANGGGSSGSKSQAHNLRSGCYSVSVYSSLLFPKGTVSKLG